MCFRRITIFEYERGLKYREGRFQEVLNPGAHWYMPFFTQIFKVDVRPRFVSIPGQEVLSADGVTLKVSLAAKYEIVDPATAINKEGSYLEALYLELQIAAREIIGQSPIEEILSKRDEMSQRLHAQTSEKIATLGVKLSSVSIKDIMFPGELKQIFAQVVKARQEGLANLEKARGETAALRHLANAAHMVEKSPALMQLRLLQALGQSTGNTVILGIPAQSAPIPIRPPGPQDDPPATQAKNA